MKLNEYLISVAFIFGIFFSAYILTHIKLVIKTNEKWRGAAIAALCGGSFLFFAFVHPKVTKIVADLFGAKIEVANLDKKIEEKMAIIVELEKQTSNRKNELISLEKLLDKTYVFKENRPLIQTLNQLQRNGQTVAIFPNQVAINPQLAAKQSGINSLPQKFKYLQNDAWVVINGQNDEMTAIGEVAPSSTATISVGTESKADKFVSKSSTLIIEPHKNEISFVELDSADKDFLKFLIKNGNKTSKHSRHR